MSLDRYRNYLLVLAIMILGLMALGAGVRTMNAGLSCPDWPLCFGKVIPDFHPAVWFEFVHRAYAGVVALFFAFLLWKGFRLTEVPKRVRTPGILALLVLLAQIIMGGLTVLLKVKAVVVTTHLLLATVFFSSVLWMYFIVSRAAMGETVGSQSDREHSRTPLSKFTMALPLLVFVQIAIGGLVASTYAGSVCVDWPLCNGQWVPTWKGAIGLQIIHRFFAYGLALLLGALAVRAVLRRAVIPATIFRFFVAGGVLVLAQTGVGILNLLYFIPPHITVLHQTLAMLLLAVTLRLWFEAKANY